VLKIALRNRSGRTCSISTINENGRTTKHINKSEKATINEKDYITIFFMRICVEEKKKENYVFYPM